MFDLVNVRTCLHHAAYYGHADCLQAILSATKTSPVADSWGFARFVDVRDEYGATLLHLAAGQGRPRCVHHLLHAGAIVSAPTASYGFPGSTALHCVRELLAWGTDRLHRDSAGRITYAAAEPMVWPSPLKFISELNPEAKALLEAALMEANREWEKQLIVNLKRSTTAKTDSSAYSSSANDEGTAAAG